MIVQFEFKMHKHLFLQHRNSCIVTSNSQPPPRFSLQRKEEHGMSPPSSWFQPHKHPRHGSFWGGLSPLLWACPHRGVGTSHKARLHTVRGEVMMRVFRSPTAEQDPNRTQTLSRTVSRTSLSPSCGPPRPLGHLPGSPQRFRFTKLDSLWSKPSHIMSVAS